MVQWYWWRDLWLEAHREDMTQFFWPRWFKESWNDSVHSTTVKKACGTQNVRHFTPRLHLSRCQIIHSKNRLCRIIPIVCVCVYVWVGECFHDPLHVDFNLRDSSYFYTAHDLSAEIYHTLFILFEPMFYVFFRNAVTRGD